MHWFKFSLYHNVKQTNTNPQKYFHAYSLKQIIYAHVDCRQSQKRPAKGSNCEEDDWGLPLYVGVIALFARAKSEIGIWGAAALTK